MGRFRDITLVILFTNHGTSAFLSFTISGYKSTTSIAGNYNFTSVSGDGDDGSGELLLGNLSKYTRYTVVVQAFNQIGPGPLSEPATAQTMEDGKNYQSILSSKT